MKLFKVIAQHIHARLEERRLRAQLRAVQDGRPHRHWSVRMLQRVCRLIKRF